MFIEGVGNVFRGSEDFGTKGNGLVRWRGRVFARKGFKKGPVFGRVGGVRRGEGFLPFLSVVSCDGLGDFVIESLDVGVGGVMLSEMVTLSDEGRCFRREVGGVGLDVTGRDGMFGGCEEDLAEGELAGGAGGGRR